MLTKNALRLLSRFAEVESSGRWHRAAIGELTVAVRSANGAVSSFGFYRGGRRIRHLQAKTLTAAVRFALAKSTLLRPCEARLAISVEVCRVGRSFRPLAIFVVSEFNGSLQPDRASATYQSESPDALAVAAGCLADAFPHPVLLDWLEERGGEMAEVIAASRI